MSVWPSDVELYGSANMPEADSATVGGSIDFTKQVQFFDVLVQGTIDIVSGSGADTGVNFTYLSRDPSGATVTVTGTCNGTVAVTGSQQVQRLLAAVVSGGSIAGLSNPGGATAVGDIAIYAHNLVISSHTAQTGSANGTGVTPPIFKLQANDGTGAQVGYIIRIISGTGVNQLRRIIATSGYGTDVVAVNRNWSVVPDNTSVYNLMVGFLFELAPNQVKAITRVFATAAADVPGGSQRVFYEKIFAVNNNITTALTPVSPNSGVGFQLASNSPVLTGGVLLDLGIETSFNGTASVANRQSAPGALGFTTQPANVFAPSPGNLAPGASPNTANSIGLWLRLTVPAGSTPYNGATLPQITGNTT
jgi:hypothetical protein